MRTFSLALLCILLLPAITLLTGCSDRATDNQEASSISTSGISTVSLVNSEADFSLADEFGDYWYQGEAELTSYELEQARYGEVHEGEAVLIFVTEDLSKSKQVKLDNPAGAPDDKVSVLKLNLTKNFTTGIYPYSMMSSVFTPVQRQSYPHTLKVTTSSQEWCGHTFTQLNLKKRKYALELRSYFESEGDQSLDLDDVVLEDEIWNLIRLDPSSLPTGAFEIIPGTMYQRLSHSEWTELNAEASLETSADNAEMMVYTLTYPEQKRTLKINFQATFPHEIESWEETARSGFGPDAQQLTTRATKIKRIKLDYWNWHDVADLEKREALGLR